MAFNIFIFCYIGEILTEQVIAELKIIVIQDIFEEIDIGS